MSEASKVIDHDRIRSWTEARGGQPAAVAATRDDDRDGARLQIKFADSGELEVIDWDEFFEIFEASGLAVLLQDETEDGSPSRFAKFVSR